jgi:uncharacterized protein (TIGR02284 family)
LRHEPHGQSRDAGLSVLSDLVGTAEGGALGFSLARRDIREPEVVDLLRQAQESCHGAAIELREQVRLLADEMGSDNAEEPRVYRGWVDFRVLRDTKSILEECERGGDYARSRYEAAMKVELPESARTVVERHYRQVMVIHDRVRALRGRFPRAES